MPQVVANMPFIRKANDGIVFKGDHENLSKIKEQMAEIITALGWKDEQVVMKDGRNQGYLQYVLRRRENDLSTSELHNLSRLDIDPDTYVWHNADTGHRSSAQIASKKEIFACMLQHGRAHVFEGEFCSVEVMLQHINLRRSICEWAMEADFVFGEGETQRFNKKYWDDEFRIKRPFTTKDALMDCFSSFHYHVDCLDACKIIMLQGIFTELGKLPNAKSKLEYLESLARRDPLREIEFERDQDGEPFTPGKFLDSHNNVPTQNIIPGDWLYIRNDDERSRRQPGLQGTNILAKGLGETVAYYHGENDKSLEDQAYKVYAWRRNPKPRSGRLIEELLTNTDQDIGLVTFSPVRDFPRFFPITSQSENRHIMSELAQDLLGERTRLRRNAGLDDDSVVARNETAVDNGRRSSQNQSSGFYPNLPADSDSGSFMTTHINGVPVTPFPSAPITNSVPRNNYSRADIGRTQSSGYSGNSASNLDNGSFMTTHVNGVPVVPFRSAPITNGAIQNSPSRTVATPITQYPSSSYPYSSTPTAVLPQGNISYSTTTYFTVSPPPTQSYSTTYIYTPGINPAPIPTVQPQAVLPQPIYYYPPGYVVGN